ncbi:reticulon-4-interacting protein 1, mitochondrial-like isoform X1 [Maniola jurtina]|uniref:reticulon-4-interacting protein 1, mitochondrial-like isoform X1 n=2 Tax=Maniola jurtina TaxID=191418 RepID=UPI001E68C07C|nr:reticulon-4-interacting protein 1, mitochondrial-like isoform X1 [Maniola jurtina]
MDEFKLRAGEKIEALHDAAIVAANTSKNRFYNVFEQTADAIARLRETFQEMWHNELVTEGRARAVAWAQETARRIQEGAPPLSPMVLYQELVTLLKDHVWRRSVIIFLCGVAFGGSAGLVIGFRAGSRAPGGPHARALHTQIDQTVILVEDAVSPGAAAGEVLIRVQAFSVSSADRGVLRGRASALRSLVTSSPVTVGRGFAGVVLDVGAGVSDLEMGDEVWGCVSEWSGGAANELLAIRSTRVSKRPRHLAADTAASLPWAGTLALTAIHKIRYNLNNCKGKRVCVIGAGSGEGCALVQLLSYWGARLTVAAPRKAHHSLKNLGAHEFIDTDGSNELAAPSWLQLEQYASRAGPWDCALCCAGAGAPPFPLPGPNTLLKATAPRKAMVELRPKSLITDRLPTPFWILFAASFYTIRMCRWLLGCGSHTDWLEDRHHLRPGLEALRQLVESGQLSPVLDKVFLPQDFESALAHACGDDTIGTTVIRFP